MMGRRIAAWGVHLFTASGSVLSLLALNAAFAHERRAALSWMALAMAVDSFDGMLARIVGVKAVLPGFDGELLDNILDYLGYVVVPAVLVLTSSLAPAGGRLPLACLILLASAYQFCQRDAKTADHFFKGFPCFWNVVVFYMFFVPTGPGVNALVLVVLCAGVFVPLKWAYPSRMPALRAPLLALTILWGASIAALLATYPEPPVALLVASLAYLPVYASFSLWLSIRGRAPATESEGTPAP